MRYCYFLLTLFSHLHFFHAQLINSNYTVLTTILTIFRFSYKAPLQLTTTLSSHSKTYSHNHLIHTLRARNMSSHNGIVFALHIHYCHIHMPRLFITHVFLTVSQFQNFFHLFQFSHCLPLFNHH